MRKIRAYGIEYKNMKELAKVHKVNYYTLKERLKTGIRVEEAIEMGNNKHAVTVFGKECKSMVELSKVFGIDCRLVEEGLLKGGDIEDVVINILTTSKITFEGKEYGTLTELSNEYGIDGTILTRRVRFGWTLYDAVLSPVDTRRIKPRGYKFRGKVYDSQREMAGTYGINVSMVRNHRDKLGLGIEDTMELLEGFLEGYGGDRPTKISKVPFIIYDGGWFDTLKRFCDYINITPKELKNFMWNNKIESHYEAFTLMSELRRDKWIDSDGEPGNVLDMCEKYRTTVGNLEKMGYARKENLRVFPECTFNKDKTFEMPLKDFERYIERVVKVNGMVDT